MASDNDRVASAAAWILDSPVGASMVYWRGFLADDRARGPKPIRKAATKIGDLFWAAAITPKSKHNANGDAGFLPGLGLVALTQRRVLGRGSEFEYIATKVRAVNPSTRAYHEAVLQEGA